LNSDFGGDEDGDSEASELDTGKDAGECWSEGVDDENCVVDIDIVSPPSLGTVLSMLCRKLKKCT